MLSSWSFLFHAVILLCIGRTVMRFCLLLVVKMSSTAESVQRQTQQSFHQLVSFSWRWCAKKQDELKKIAFCYPAWALASWQQTFSAPKWIFCPSFTRTTMTMITVHLQRILSIVCPNKAKRVKSCHKEIIFCGKIGHFSLRQICISHQNLRFSWQVQVFQKWWQLCFTANSFVRRGERLRRWKRPVLCRRWWTSFQLYGVFPHINDFIFHESKIWIVVSFKPTQKRL